MIISKSYLSVSHAAAYAVVSYQTAWLKYYYPAEYMAALLNSIMHDISKISQYILVSRQMNIPILPPDINEGDWGFTAIDGKIRYGLSGIRNIGRNVVVSIVEEREKNGKFRSLKDFIDRVGGREVNKRTIENFIKSGAMDSLPGTRKQKMMVYNQLLEEKTREEKSGISGQMSLFDFFGQNSSSEAEESSLGVEFPEVGEYDRDLFLQFEKETLGIYVSGHPMESWQDTWQKEITNTSADFEADSETGMSKVHDGEKVITGGIITGKKINITKNNKRMAFLEMEDLTGSIEVIVFPNDLEKQEKNLEVDSRVFISGRVSASDNAAAKLICERVIPLAQVPKKVWIRCRDISVWHALEKQLYDVIDSAPGNSSVNIYLEKEKAQKTLPAHWRMEVSPAVLEKLYNIFLEPNVKVIDMPIDKSGSLH